ncbi:MAG: hypothetical protein D6750_01685 [Bacteroidetes bacterium]|jgi:hypothetical protein|nr:MAG: hypothetical protein D6750_01685 [Bacteroidota bacterium]
MDDQNQIVLRDNHGSETCLVVDSAVPVSSHQLELADLIDSLEPVIELIPQYREFSVPGEKSRGLYLGTTVITKKTEDGAVFLTAVQWLEKPHLWLNAGVTLVRALESIEPNSAIEIEFLGLKGRVKLYQVRLLA